MANNDFDDFERDLLQMAKEFKGGKYAKQFLKRQAKKLNKEQRKQAESLTNRRPANSKNKNKPLLKSFKAGKPYEYSDELAVRAYSNAPHAHLLNDGHRILTRGKNLKKPAENNGRWEAERRGKGREVGFVMGVKFMEKAQGLFEDKNYKDTQKFIDQMLEKYEMS